MKKFNLKDDLQSYLIVMNHRLIDITYATANMQFGIWCCAILLLAILLVMVFT